MSAPTRRDSALEAFRHNPTDGSFVTPVAITMLQQTKVGTCFQENILVADVGRSPCSPPQVLSSDLLPPRISPAAAKYLSFSQTSSSLISLSDKTAERAEI
ncbi:hypothetical protein J6590_061750 [Homalodisca vitripennis]|nr:hypothetical protein J6590_061750 [Homalodisca vitripennis]